MDFINSEEIIMAVKRQPSVWDTACSDYKNREVKANAWRVICEDVVEDFADIQDDRARIDICKKVQLKWKSMRDSFRKDYFLNIHAPSGSGKKKRKYLYANQMQFILKTIEGAETESNIMQLYYDEPEYSEIPFQPKVVKKAKKQNLQKPVEPPIVDNLNEQDKVVESDETALFFQSLLSSVKDFTEDEKLQLKGGVISIITNIRRARYSQNNGFQRPGSTKCFSSNR